jgi:hypothetical protein
LAKGSLDLGLWFLFLTTQVWLFAIFLFYIVYSEFHCHIFIRSDALNLNLLVNCLLQNTWKNNCVQISTEKCQILFSGRANFGFY